MPPFRGGEQIAGLLVSIGAAGPVVDCVGNLPYAAYVDVVRSRVRPRAASALFRGMRFDQVPLRIEL